MHRIRTRLTVRLCFEELEPRTLLSGSSFFASTVGYSAGDGGILAPGTGTSFAAGVSGTPIGAEFGDVDAGGFGPAEGFGSGFGIPGGSAEAGPSGFGAVGSGGFGTAAGLPSGIGTVGILPAEIGLNSLPIEVGGLSAPDTIAFGGAPSGAEISAAARDDSGVGQITTTTGSNTLGIRSFASPTSGYSEGFTGAGGPVGGGESGEEESGPNLKQGPDGDDKSISRILAIELLFAGDDVQPWYEANDATAPPSERMPK